MNELYESHNLEDSCIDKSYYVTKDADGSVRIHGSKPIYSNGFWRSQNPLEECMRLSKSWSSSLEIFEKLTAGKDLLELKVVNSPSTSKEYYIARDGGGSLYMYNERPVKVRDFYRMSTDTTRYQRLLPIEDELECSLFGHLTFNDQPLILVEVSEVKSSVL